MNPIIKSLIVSKAKKTYQLKEIKKIIFLGNYETDILNIHASDGLIIRESENMKLSENKDKIEIFKNDVLANLKADNLHSFEITLNFENNKIESEIKFYLNGEKLKTKLTSEL